MKYLIDMNVTVEVEVADYSDVQERIVPTLQGELEAWSNRMSSWSAWSKAMRGDNDGEFLHEKIRYAPCVDPPPGYPGRDQHWVK